MCDARQLWRTSPLSIRRWWAAHFASQRAGVEGLNGHVVSGGERRALIVSKLHTSTKYVWDVRKVYIQTLTANGVLVVEL